MSGPASHGSRLAVALLALERAFGPRWDRIAPIHACSHCFDPEDLAVLAGPVAEIPDRLFLRAVGKWGTTMDAQVPLWRRLTPRILRQMAERSLHIDATLIAQSSARPPGATGPAEESSAVGEFCEGWFEAALTAPDGPSAVEVLPFVAVMYQDIGHWLAAWSATTGRRAQEQLASLARWWLPELLNGELDISFSADLPDIAAESTAWLLAETPSRLREEDLSADEPTV